jgi:pyruvyl transferase EpsO
MTTRLLPDGGDFGRNSEDRLILQNLADRATACIEPGTQAALLNIPHHSNCGDAAILQGDLQAFRNRNIDLAYIAHSDTYNIGHLRSALPSQGTVYLHGGGSFGDLYPDTHAFLLDAFRELHDYRVVMLPQTARFSTGYVDDLTRRTIDSHPNCKLYFRDKRSYELAVSAFQVPCGLAPDMAFALGPIDRPILANIPILFLGRTDIERRESFNVVKASDLVVSDWPGTENISLGKWSLPAQAIALAVRTSRFTPRLSPAVSRQLVSLSKRRFNRGCRMLAQGQIVVTDRLHGHILSTLMGIRNIAFENGYGKVETFIDTWTSLISYVQVSDNVESSLQLARAPFRPQDIPPLS